MIWKFLGLLLYAGFGTFGVFSWLVLVICALDFLGLEVNNTVIVNKRPVLGATLLVFAVALLVTVIAFTGNWEG